MLINLFVIFVSLIVNCMSIKSEINNEVIKFHKCNLTDLNIFENTNINFKEIYIQHCHIDELPNAIFLRLKSLHTLELSDSRLYYIQDFAFNGLENLKSLNLIRNNISELKSWNDNLMNSLISLDLRRNQIKELNKKFFLKFPHLQKLNFAVNYIEYIPDGVFKCFANSLKYLNLGKNFIAHINVNAFRGLIKLQHLALHNNQIHSINELAFETNTHLKSLRLECNQIVTLDFMMVSSLFRLIHFNISHNQVESLEKFSFAKDFELKDLDISFNNIYNISEDTLSGLQSLEMLNASHNNINHIDARSFLELTNLLHLDLSINNLIIFSSNLFNYSIQLEYLNLSKNSIKLFDSKIFEQLKTLKFLDLSKNQLDHDNFLNFQSNIKYLDLSQNQFKSLNITLLYGMDFVNLEGNPWYCNWLLKQLIRAPTFVHFGLNYSMESGNWRLDVPGIDCFDGKIWKSLIVIDNRKFYQTELLSTAASAQPVWPKLRFDRFDQKTVIIWLIISVVVIFVGLRGGKYLWDRMENKEKLKLEKLREENKLENKEEYMELNQQTTH